MSASTVLVINSGSSSLKFSLFDTASGEEIVTGLAERLGTEYAVLGWKFDGDRASKDIAKASHREALQAVMSPSKIKLAKAERARIRDLQKKQKAELQKMRESQNAAIAKVGPLPPQRDPRSFFFPLFKKLRERALSLSRPKHTRERGVEQVASGARGQGGRSRHLPTAGAV